MSGIYWSEVIGEKKRKQRMIEGTKGGFMRGFEVVVEGVIEGVLRCR